MRRDVRRRFARIVSHGVSRRLLASFAFLSRRWDVRVRGARRRFSNFVSSGTSRLTCAKFGVFCRRHDDWLWYPFSCPMASGSASMLSMVSSVLATVSVGFQTLCPITFRSLFVPNMVSCCGVTTLGVGLKALCSVISRVTYMASLGGVGFPTSCPVAFRGLFVPNMASYVRLDDWHRDAWWRLFNVAPNGFEMLICPEYGVLCRRVLKCRRDALRRFSYFVSIDVSWPICAKNGV
jgi:hypothetical protein